MHRTSKRFMTIPRKVLAEYKKKKKKTLRKKYEKRGNAQQTESRKVNRKELARGGVMVIVRE